MTDDLMTYDILVVGSGIAGLTFALKVAEQCKVAVVTKKEKVETSTNYAQGGIASVLSPDDSFDLHIQDTLSSGDGLCHSDVVEMVIKEGPQRCRWDQIFSSISIKCIFMESYPFIPI